MAYLLSISIGPVQDFIAAARKTRDLWFGSEMLCEVSRTVASFLRDSGAELIFPEESAVDVENPQPIANKILCLVTPGDPKTLAEESEGKALERLQDYKDDMNSALRKKGVKLTHPDLVQPQIDGFLEFNAAWWPMKDDSSDYKSSREQVELLLAGRKALRDFRPACGREGIPKSSLDAGREAVLDAREKQGNLNQKQRLSIGVKRGELLDSISLIKRVADPRRFVSVARIAADPFIRRLSDETLKKLCGFADQLKNTDLVQRFGDEHLRHYRSFPYDAQLFFGEPSEADLREWPECAETAKAFYKEVKETAKGIPSPNPYFAVLAADGDHMGKLISTIESKDKHKAFSKTLAGFAARAEVIVKDHYGAMVYSGGDDVLAFLPLDTALDCTDRLRTEFATMLEPYVVGGMQTTLSCGLSIAHYGEHLQDLIEWARIAERAAKQPKGKNSLAVHLHTRTAGLEHVAAVSSWVDQPVTNRWAKWIEVLATERLPVSAPHDLRSLVRELRGTVSGESKDFVKGEVKRILERKRGERGTKPLEKDEIEELLTHIGTGIEDLDRFVNELIIARHFVRVKGKGQVGKEVKANA